MKMNRISILLLAAASVPTGAAAATMTYGSVDIIPGSDVGQRYEIARDMCTLEAQTPPRGNQQSDNFYHRTALRACLYRKGFSEDGSYVYPVPLFGSPHLYR